jgi:hypothetical protein
VRSTDREDDWYCVMTSRDLEFMDCVTLEALQARVAAVLDALRAGSLEMDMITVVALGIVAYCYGPESRTFNADEFHETIKTLSPYVTYDDTDVPVTTFFAANGVRLENADPHGE